MAVSRQVLTSTWKWILPHSQALKMDLLCRYKQRLQCLQQHFSLKSQQFKMVKVCSLNCHFLDGDKFLHHYLCNSSLLYISINWRLIWVSKMVVFWEEVVTHAHIGIRTHTCNIIYYTHYTTNLQTTCTQTE